MFCPLCSGTTMGRVGSNQYFCSECYLEFSFNKDDITVYKIDDDGGLQFVGEIDWENDKLIVFEKNQLYHTL